MLIIIYLSATAIAAGPSCFTHCASLVAVNSVGLAEWRLKIGYWRIGGLDAWRIGGLWIGDWRIGVARELPGAGREL